MALVVVVSVSPEVAPLSTAPVASAVLPDRREKEACEHNITRTVPGLCDWSPRSKSRVRHGGGMNSRENLERLTSAIASHGMAKQRRSEATGTL